MRILIVSQTPWDIENSFGNTFSNLFGGMEDIEIYNICCKGGKVQNDVIKKCFQMTDRQAAKSIYKRNYSVGTVIEQSETLKIDQNVLDFSGTTYKRVVSQRSILALMARDMIWKASSWKLSGALHQFLQEAHPDIIYLPIYNSGYMCDIQNYLVSLSHIPVVGHISDDVYGFPQGYLVSPLHLFYVARTRAKLRKLISRCSYLEVFAENMKKEYEEIFHIPCYLIGKGVHPEQICTSDSCVLLAPERELLLAYTGNIGSERWKVLCDLGRCLDGQQQKARLEIYSATPLTAQMQEAMAQCASICFMGSTDAAGVRDVQSRADFLVHTESFSKRAIHSARMSLSTKIIDYLCTGKPILAIGPSVVNSISFLKSHHLAVVADETVELDTVVGQLFRGKVDLTTMAQSVSMYLKTERNIEHIQSGMRTRMQQIIEQNCTSMPPN